jgi:hypothetical protein
MIRSVPWTLPFLLVAGACGSDRGTTPPASSPDGGPISIDGGSRPPRPDPSELVVSQTECESLCAVLAERCGAPPGAADGVCFETCGVGLTRSEVECFQSQDCAALEAFAFGGEPLCGIGFAACGDGVCQSGEHESSCPDDCSTSCTPRCGGAECGPDGCGGSCGSCDGGESCEDGECESPPTPSCTPSCSDRECGSDGCGGTCGSCDSDETCRFGTCGLTCAADGSVGDCSGVSGISCCNPDFSCDAGQRNRCCAFFGHPCETDADCCVVGMSGGVRIGCVPGAGGGRVCDAM